MIAHKRLIRILITLFSLVTIVGISRNLYSLWQNGDGLNERKLELLALEKKQTELREKLLEVQSPEFIERSARNELGLIKEGEAIVLVPRTQNPELNDQIETEDIPNWKKWWRLFF